MPDATYDAPADDPIIGINLVDLHVSMGPPRAVRIIFRKVRSSGALAEPQELQLIDREGNNRATRFLTSWTQLNPVRKMIANVREEGDLVGVTET